MGKPTTMNTAAHLVAVTDSSALALSHLLDRDALGAFCAISDVLEQAEAARDELAGVLARAGGL